MIQSIVSLIKSLVKDSKYRQLNKVVIQGFKASRDQQSRKSRIEIIASLTKSLVKEWNHRELKKSLVNDSKNRELNKVVS